MFFLCDYALPVTLTFDVRMNNALRAAMITWFQQLPAIGSDYFHVTRYPGLYISVGETGYIQGPYA